MKFNKLSSNDDISAGSVVVDGTRVNFQTIAIGVVDAGLTRDEIRTEYGGHFDDETIEQCVTLFKYIRRNLDEFSDLTR